jgi:hypothetical protein
MSIFKKNIIAGTTIDMSPSFLSNMDIDNDDMFIFRKKKSDVSYLSVQGFTNPRWSLHVSGSQQATMNEES